MKKRFFIYQSTENQKTDRAKSLYSATCHILDRETLEPNPEAPEFKRYKRVKTNLKYLDAWQECEKLNAPKKKDVPPFDSPMCCGTISCMRP